MIVKVRSHTVYQQKDGRYGNVTETEKTALEDMIKDIEGLEAKIEETEDELATIVNFGGTVVDVFVWHKVYGKMTAPLNIFSSLHIKQFIEGVRSGKSTELMNITGGYHYHTVRAESESVLDEIEQALKAKNYTVPEI